MKSKICLADKNDKKRSLVVGQSKYHLYFYFMFEDKKYGVVLLSIRLLKDIQKLLSEGNENAVKVYHSEVGGNKYAIAFQQSDDKTVKISFRLNNASKCQVYLDEIELNRMNEFMYNCVESVTQKE